MANDFPSFEAVDSHIQSVEAEAYDTEGRITTANVASNSLETVCEAYKTIRPILMFVQPFIPPRWRTVLSGFIAVMDRLCP